MLSRKEEERNEKIIRGLLKLPPNRRCINCNSLGPQYACTNFWTFICTTCSGIHREFTHRVKSVSMAKFTTQEVQSLERGGNQRAKEYFLKEWDMQNTRLPSSSNPDRIREFIKAVYVEKKFARGISSDKPPRVTQNHKNFDEDRKASSYHSYSQSPPYDNQYEDRRYGKSSGIQTRRTGSERLSYDGKLHSAEYYDDRFSNDGSGPRNSDFSVSSTGDMTKYDVQSPNFHKGTEYMSPPMQPVRDILLEDKNVTVDVNKNPHPQRTVSSSSFGSIHSVEVMPFSSTSLFDVGIDSETPSGTQIIDVATPSSSLPQSSVQSPAPENDLFGLLSGDQSTNSASQLIDLFAEINQIPPSNQNTVQVPFLENTGWATFDTTQPSVSIVEPKSTLHNVSHVDGKPDGNLGAYSTETNISNWVPVKSSNVSENVNSITDQWNITSNQTNAVAPSSSEFWNAFDFSTGMSSQTSRNPALNTSSLVPYVERQDLFDGLELPEDSGRYGFHGMASGVGTSTQSISFGDTVVPKIPSVSPAMEVKTHERKSLNPFDFPCEPDLGHGNSFGTGSLHDALPNPQFQNNILQNLFIDDPATSFISPVPSSGFSYMTAQQSNPQLTTLSSPSQVGSPGGNPFA